MGMPVTFVDPAPFVERQDKSTVDLRPKSSRDILERCRRKRDEDFPER